MVAAAPTLVDLVEWQQGLLGLVLAWARYRAVRGWGILPLSGYCSLGTSELEGRFRRTDER